MCGWWDRGDKKLSEHRRTQGQMPESGKASWRKRYLSKTRRMSRSKGESDHGAEAAAQTAIWGAEGVKPVLDLV